MANDKLRRWIDLLAALLRRNRPATLEELVDDVPAYRAYLAEERRERETARRMFERDKDDLRTFGVPIRTVPGEDGEAAGYELKRTHFYLPYLTVLRDGRKSKPDKVDRYGYKALQELAFEPDELEAIVEAALRVQRLGDRGLAELAASALRKLAFDLPVDALMRDATVASASEEPAASTAEVMQGPREAPRLPYMASAIPAGRSEPAPSVLEALDEALRGRKHVVVEYYAMGSDTLSTRTLAPYGLFFLGHHWYVAAREAEQPAGPVKNFRVSRIRSAVVNRRKPGSPDYEIPADFRLREHARSRQAWELGDGAALEAIVAFTGPTGPTRAALRLGEPVEGEPTQRRFVVRRVDTFTRWLLGFAGEAEPLAPPELVDAYHALAARALAVYGGGDD
ncbi:MAG TPA: WYL domain-containing protein [Gemmatimonadales bacterium]|nr:WYL domain-containing protein [Gemmatimonadales bacterium]